MDDPLALALLAAACAVAESALPEREPHPRAFQGLVSIIGRLGQGAEAVLADYVRWEADLLAELGYGLDLTCCAGTGTTEDLIWVSPKSGRAVSAGAGAPYADRLLPLPHFLLAPAGHNNPSDPAAWLAGLRLTGHFLGKDAYGLHRKSLPAARSLLLDRVAALADGTAPGASSESPTWPRLGHHA